MSDITKLILENLIGFAALLLAGLTPFIVGKVTRYLEDRLDFDIDESDEYRLSRAVTEGIQFAEEEARNRVKGGLPAPASDQKLLSATQYVLSMIHTQGLPERGAEWITNKIQAYLNESRPEEKNKDKSPSNGTSGSTVLPLLLVIFLGSSALTTGCGGFDYGKLALSVKDLRQGVTETMDPYCLSIAETACDKTKPATDCPKLVSCRELRHNFYTATKGMQIAIRGAKVLDDLGDKSGAKNLIAYITPEVIVIWSKLIQYKIIPGLSKVP